jgi:hypothetical protein
MSVFYQCPTSSCLSISDLEQEHILYSMYLRTSLRECSPEHGILLLKVPLITILISTIVAAGWVTAWIFQMQAARRAGNNPTGNIIQYPCENP